MLYLFIGELIPHYFYVPKIYLEAERKKPHSQIRLPSSEEDGDIFLWGQSLLIIMNLLGTKKLTVERISVGFKIRVFAMFLPGRAFA